MAVTRSCCWPCDIDRGTDFAASQVHFKLFYRDFVTRTHRNVTILLRDLRERLNASIRAHDFIDIRHTSTVCGRRRTTNVDRHQLTADRLQNVRTGHDTEHVLNYTDHPMSISHRLPRVSVKDLPRLPRNLMLIRCSTWISVISKIAKRAQQMAGWR